MASKFLVLQESVRDAADLYLSLKYPPPLFICDTPCGFARHMDCCTPVVANKLWKRFSGCFEVPSCGEAPMEVCTFQLLHIIILRPARNPDGYEVFITRNCTVAYHKIVFPVFFAGWVTIDSHFHQLHVFMYLFS